MEILGSGPDESARRTSDRDRQPAPMSPAQLDLGPMAEAHPDGTEGADSATDLSQAPTGGDGPAGPRAMPLHGLRALVSAEALGLTALLVQLTGLTGFFNPVTAYVLAPDWEAGDEPSQLARYATAAAVTAGIGLVLGIAALLVLPREPAPLARALAGSAVLISLLMLIGAALMSTSQPEEPAPDVRSAPGAGAAVRPGG